VFANEETSVKIKDPIIYDKTTNLPTTEYQKLHIQSSTLIWKYFESRNFQHPPPFIASFLNSLSIYIFMNMTVCFLMQSYIMQQTWTHFLTATHLQNTT